MKEGSYKEVISLKKIGLIDVDGHNFPNLALMKLSAWHKSQGDNVQWYDPLFSENMDVVYMSKVFDFTPDYQYQPRAGQIIQGGTGYSLQGELSEEIEHNYPDYELYPQYHEAYGFLTRGCPRGCEFCIVADKEGHQAKKVANLSAFWHGQKEIKLLDPNLLASPDRIDLLGQLIESNSWVDFTQGLDIRFMNDQIAGMINQIKVKMIHFAWDNYEFDTYNKLKEYRKAFKYSYRKLGVYVLTNFNTTLEQDLERIYKLKELDYDPFVMVYDKHKAPLKIKQMQRWVNNKIIFHSGTAERFGEYLQKVARGGNQMSSLCRDCKRTYQPDYYCPWYKERKMPEGAVWFMKKLDPDHKSELAMVSECPLFMMIGQPKNQEVSRDAQ